MTGDNHSFILLNVLLVPTREKELMVGQSRGEFKSEQREQKSKVKERTTEQTVIVCEKSELSREIHVELWRQLFNKLGGVSRAEL